MNYWQLLIFCFWFQLARKKSGEKEHGGIGAGQIKDITSVDSYQITCIWLTDRSIGFQIVEFVWLFARFTWIFILTDSRNTKQLNNRLSIPACQNITKTKSLEINTTPWYMPDHEVIHEILHKCRILVIKTNNILTPCIVGCKKNFKSLYTFYSIPDQTHLASADFNSRTVIEGCHPV